MFGINKFTISPYGIKVSIGVIRYSRYNLDIQYYTPNLSNMTYTPLISNPPIAYMNQSHNINIDHSTINNSIMTYSKNKAELSYIIPNNIDFTITRLSNDSTLTYNTINLSSMDFFYNIANISYISSTNSLEMKYEDISNISNMFKEGAEI